MPATGIRPGIFHWAVVLAASVVLGSSSVSA